MNISNQPPLLPRREFLAETGRGIIGLTTAGILAQAGGLNAAPAALLRRIGAVAYNYQYNLGLFTYKNRPGDKMDNLGFVEAVHEAGGKVAQFYGPLLSPLDEAALKRIRARAEELDIRLEVQGGTAQQANYIEIMERSAALGVKMIGCSFGMLMRPDKIATLAAWDEHMRKCEERLRELAPHAKRLGLVIGVENHLDFSLEEIHGLLRKIDSPQIGSLFDVGNWFGTLDDPIAAAELLGPYVVATHYKDFAVQETPQGFTLTMVPLGCGSLDLPGITAALLKNLRPEANMAIEMMNGQTLEINWLKPGFWAAFRNRTAEQVAATLRHIRRQTVNRAECIPQTEVDKMPHAQHLELESTRTKQCIDYLRKLIQT